MCLFLSLHTSFRPVSISVNSNSTVAIYQGGEIEVLSLTAIRKLNTNKTYFTMEVPQPNPILADLSLTGGGNEVVQE